jgi:hypothetical protein
MYGWDSAGGRDETSLEVARLSPAHGCPSSSQSDNTGIDDITCCIQVDLNGQAQAPTCLSSSCRPGAGEVVSPNLGMSFRPPMELAEADEGLSIPGQFFLNRACMHSPLLYAVMTNTQPQQHATMAEKRKRSDDGAKASSDHSKKPKRGFTVGPQNLPDGIYKRKSAVSQPHPQITHRNNLTDPYPPQKQRKKSRNPSSTAPKSNNPTPNSKPTPKSTPTKKKPFRYPPRPLSIQT